MRHETVGRGLGTMSAPTTHGPRPAPLDGVRIVELANYVTGPYAAALLADMGASVTKIEEPTQGDPFRGWGRGGYSPTFRSVNRGKRSVGLDLRSADGAAIALELIDTADVLVENLRPGALDRLGLGEVVVRARNPRLIYCSISGFGSRGPYRDRPGYDTVGQAMSGLLGLLTDLDDPQPMGISLSDHLTGIYAALGVAVALAGRGERRDGGRVETSLLQATTAFVAENAARYFDEDEVPTRATRARIAQAYAFVAGDGLPFAIHLSSPPKFWEGLTAAVDRPDLRTDPRFVDRAARVAHYDELRAILTAHFSTAPRATWLERLEAHDVPAGAIHRLDEVFADPGVEALALVHEVRHPSAGTMRLLGAPVTVDGADDREIAPPPLLGEHTELVLRELGRDETAIDRLRAAGVIR
jgi:crotonobetainyl-CoA:carnitine CoA-transferase CaiB-like acyl-CoA transferase